MLALALAIAAGVIAVLFAIGQFHGFRKEPLTAAPLYDLLKIGFAFAAGVGGVVALVTGDSVLRSSPMRWRPAPRTAPAKTLSTNRN
jgi:hypothetical protein